MRFGRLICCEKGVCVTGFLQSDLSLGGNEATKNALYPRSHQDPGPIEAHPDAVR